MKLDKDCVRELLLFVEKQKFDDVLYPSQLQEFINKTKYSEEDVIYCIQKLKEADFITGGVKYASNAVYTYWINNITWDGHQFLDTVRDPKIWSDTKKVASKVTDVSISLIAQIASNLIAKQLNLN